MAHQGHPYSEAPYTDYEEFPTETEYTQNYFNGEEYEFQGHMTHNGEYHEGGYGQEAEYTGEYEHMVFNEAQYGETEGGFEITYGDAFEPPATDDTYPDFSHFSTGYEPLDPAANQPDPYQMYTDGTFTDAYENPFDITDQCEADLAALEEAERAMKVAMEQAERQAAKAAERAAAAKTSKDKPAVGAEPKPSLHHSPARIGLNAGLGNQPPLGLGQEQMRGGRGVQRATSVMNVGPGGGAPPPAGFMTKATHGLPTALHQSDVVKARAATMQSGGVPPGKDANKRPVKNMQKTASANTAAGLLDPKKNALSNSAPIGAAAANRRHSPSVVNRIDLSEVDDIPVPASHDPSIELGPHKDPDSFRLKMLLETGKIILQVAGKRATCQDIKKLLVQNEESTGISDAISKKLAFKIPGAGWIANEHEPIGTLPYFQNAAKRRDDPHLMLVRKDGTYFKAVKLDDVVIGGLLRSPIAWQQHDDENTAFRQCMARIRLQERHFVEEEKKKISSLVPVALGDEPPKKKVLITLQITSSIKKKVSVSPEETADSFLARVFKYFPESKKEKDASKYALVAKGLAVFLAGPHKLIDIEYIQRCSLTNSEVVLCLIDRKSVESEKNEGPYLFEAEENFLSSDPVIHYDHNQIVSGQGPANVKSVWDLQDLFSVQIIALANLPQSKPGSQVYVRMTVLCGDDLVVKPQQTKDAPIDQNGSSLINQPLPTPVKMTDLPRECKLVFSVWIIDKKQKKQKEASGDSVAWVNCLVFDYKNELRAGLLKLRLWPGVAQPSGTVVANSDTQAVELSIQLRKEEQGIVRVFPTELLDLPVEQGRDNPSGSDKQKLDACIGYHSLNPLSAEEKALCRKYKTYCMQNPSALAKYLQSVVKTEKAQVQESHRLIEKWAPVRSPVDALELLDAKYPDSVVRSYAVRQLEKLTNAEVEDYLLQLVQVLKYESYHDSPLSRFLLKRAIRNKRIGHYLYWYLKSELHNPQLSERFGLLLEAFLKGGGNAREEISAQEKVHQAIVDIAYKVKGLKSGDPVAFLRGEVANLNKAWPPGCQLMLDPLFITKGIKVEKCKVMDSKMKPLWLLFENADPNGEDLNIIFKCGDDLRQDMLTLQLFRVMDKLWKKENLDLMLNPYGVIATGGETGMIEVVTSSNTISKIQKQVAGASGAFNDECLAKWLRQYNSEDMLYKLAVENFTASCAGYCVATYVLGIGDRHNDNIMLKQDGHLFHIDFGHILGNFKKKYGFKRERVPFVFTPDWAFVMGGKGSEFYNKFVQDCMRSHAILRQNAQLFINLLSMMLISGMPELSCPEDIMYVVETLNVSTDPKKKNNNESFQAMLEASGSQFSTQFNFFVHNLVH